MLEEESISAVQEEQQVLETGISAGEETEMENRHHGRYKPVFKTEEQIEADEAESAAERAAKKAAEEEAEALENVVGDYGFYIDGQPAPLETARTMRGSLTYVALAPTVKAFVPDAQVSWNSTGKTVTVKTPLMTMTAKVGEQYIEANGRYLYIQDGVEMEDSRVVVPLSVLAKAFDVSITWDSATKTIYATRGSGAIQSGDEFYAEDALFWLSRVIHAEAGNQPMKGRMAVANVVLNRVANPHFPNNIVDVLSQRNQFTTYQGGKLVNREPNEKSVIATKLVLDGGVVEETRGALYFDSKRSSWASRNKELLAVIGGHSFYR